MKDEKITLETAKLLKKKKFDIPVHTSYTEYHHDVIDNDEVTVKEGDVEINTFYFKNNNHDFGDFSNNNYTMYAAPTLSLVQKWLREVHDIDVWAKPFVVDDLKKEYLGFVDYIPNKIEGKTHITHQSYEEAIEFSIVVALKSIE
jgi:hypothetical protein